MSKTIGLRGAATTSLLALLMACQQEAVEPPAELVAEAQAISGQFVGTLLPTLQAAMQAGGPVQGIEVCSVAAPQIAADLSRESGWVVNRVSLKARNQETAIPDVWEAQVLQDFDRRQQAGEPVGQINHAAVVDGELRYMQAQPAGEQCLTCHGTDISGEVRAALSEHYPQDMATGYLAGQVRGAISLRRSL